MGNQSRIRVFQTYTTRRFTYIYIYVYIAKLGIRFGKITQVPIRISIPISNVDQVILILLTFISWREKKNKKRAVFTESSFWLSFYIFRELELVYI